MKVKNEHCAVSGVSYYPDGQISSATMVDGVKMILPNGYSAVVSSVWFYENGEIRSLVLKEPVEMEIWPGVNIKVFHQLGFYENGSVKYFGVGEDKELVLENGRAIIIKNCSNFALDKEGRIIDDFRERSAFLQEVKNGPSWPINVEWKQSDVMLGRLGKQVIDHIFQEYEFKLKLGENIIYTRSDLYENDSGYFFRPPLGTKITLNNGDVVSSKEVYFDRQGRLRKVILAAPVVLNFPDIKLTAKKTILFNQNGEIVKAW